MQQDDNQKNLLIAIVLSVGVLFFWQMFYAGPKLKEEQARREREKQVATQSAGAPGQTPGVPTPAPSTGASPGATPAAGAPPQPGTGGVPTPAPTVAMAREAALAASPRVALNTPSLVGSIALKGARIDDITLTRYRETVRPDSANVVLFSPAGSSAAYFAEHGWSVAAGSTVAVPNGDTVWQVAAGSSLTPERPLKLTWENGQGLVFHRTISVDDRYMFRIVDAVENKGSGEVVLYPFARVFRYGTPKLQGFFILHEGLLGVLDEKLREIGYGDSIKKGGGLTIEKTKGGWLGFTDKYWSAALIPDQATSYRANLQGFERRGPTAESYQTDYLKDAVVVPAGGRREVQSHLFAGAKEVKVIEGYQKALGVQKFDLMIDWGWFYFITKPLFWLIHWFFELFKNFGLAILAVTVLVKLAFFPLANKSYESMAKMKKLQPEMEKLRERYKDDAVRMREELMKLYQKEKINPAAGCLPILLQIPVFFALYKVLFVTIDMRHAPFFGWVHDLSAPDPTTIFNLFGLLPFNPGAVPLLGEFLMLGVWPIIMGITMWVQMQLNPQQPDPMQQKIFNWMPVLFTFLLASFPVGLVIYWAWNNVLSLLQQYWIMKRNGADIHLWKNLGVEKWMNSKRGSKA
jgi:YidC/Oxa1 family membrane protein insertase